MLNVIGFSSLYMMLLIFEFEVIQLFAYVVKNTLNNTHYI